MTNRQLDYIAPAAVVLPIWPRGACSACALTLLFVDIFGSISTGPIFVCACLVGIIGSVTAIYGAIVWQKHPSTGKRIAVIAAAAFYHLLIAGILLQAL